MSIISNSPNGQHCEKSHARAVKLLQNMRLAEKLGQLNQVSGEYGHISDSRVQEIKEGRVSSVINEVNLEIVNHLQKIAVEESRLGIPLLIGRDVIHGFKTIFPIPLGQAATWCEATVREGARIAAIEASSQGINWTFAPMIDITRDPRWGRIAECLGEDPYLCSRLGEAMVTGFQNDDLNSRTSIASCAKHFAGYGYSESGRDYSFANISENELRNTVLPPFNALADIGVATFMASFSDLNGLPASGNKWLMQEILRDEWQFSGVVVSDWASIKELQIHGFSENDEHSALLATEAGIDMEMASNCYASSLPHLLQANKITEKQIDAMVLRIIALKYQLGLFENPYTNPSEFPTPLNQKHLTAAKEAAIKSAVLLKNKNNILPLNKRDLNHIAVLGPLANDAYEQLGTWVFDGDINNSVDCLRAISEELDGISNVHFAKGLGNSRDKKTLLFEQAISAARQSNIAIMVMGEESILSGEAHSRSNIDLPGAQYALIEKIAETGTPIILVVMAGRPITLAPIIDKVDAILFAWHPGSMGGPAISDLLFGKAIPSGKLPLTFPRVLGQIPIYYSQKNSGRPARNECFVHQDDIEERAAQTSLGNASNHLDTHFSPLYPFGYGLSYAQFEYSDVQLSSELLQANKSISVSVSIANTSKFDAHEIVQLYIRDLVASTTRPVKELKGFKRVHIKAHSSIKVQFNISPQLLGFYGPQNTFIIENGKFHVWIGPHSAVENYKVFHLVD